MSSIINDCNTYININITMIEEEDQRYNDNNQYEPIIIKKGYRCKWTWTTLHVETN